MSSAAFNDAVVRTKFENEYSDITETSEIIMPNGYFFFQRAAIAPIVAPLLRGTVGAAASARVSHSQSAAPPGNGPCCLRVANLAQSVSANDLAVRFHVLCGFYLAYCFDIGLCWLLGSVWRILRLYYK
jgi:hypothetical protein